MSKPKILVFIDWFVPGYKAGGPIKSCYSLIQHLKSEFDFYVITRDTDYTEVKAYESIESDKWVELEDGVSVLYFSNKKLSYSNLKREVELLDFDIAYINGIYSRYFSIFPLLILKKMQVEKVVASRGMLAVGAISVSPFKKKLFLGVARMVDLYSNVVFHATNENETRDIENAVGASCKVIVAPNLSSTVNDFEKKQKRKEEGLLKLVSVARISPEKNLSYCFDILTKVKGRVLFHIYGPIYNEEYWGACQEKIKNLPGNIEVEYKGIAESQEVLNVISGYDILFMPTLGENLVM